MAYAQLTTIGGGDTAESLAAQLFDLATKAQVYVNSTGGDGGSRRYASCPKGCHCGIY